MTFAVFFGIVLLLYYATRSWTARKTILLVASYLFYAAWNPPFVLLIWISTVIDWFAARAMSTEQSPSRKRLYLLVSLSTNLGLLSFFKYGNFFLDNFVAIAALSGVQYAPPDLDIVLPVGISFYTFQTLSYSIDVYRGNLEPSGSFLDFALFVTFFPQLVAGPIVRAADFLPQCTARRALQPGFFGWGVTLMSLGLFQKVVLADALLAPVADKVYGQTAGSTFVDAWIGTLAFSAQIFFDFAGYSTVAIGAALCLGFVLPDNFRSPYAARGFSDFWRRWHISLSTWLRDYLYISLGGNRISNRRTYFNLSMTMLLGGLWHGASWRFVIWGALHGLYLVVERLLRERLGERPWMSTLGFRLGATLGTYGLVCITWVFFRATDFRGAFDIVGAMFSFAPGMAVVKPLDVATILLVTVALLGAHQMLRDQSVEALWTRMPLAMRTTLLVGMWLGIGFSPADDRAFIYFQF